MLWLHFSSAVVGHRGLWPNSKAVDTICDLKSCSHTSGSPCHRFRCCNLPTCWADLQLLQRFCESGTMGLKHTNSLLSLIVHDLFWEFVLTKLDLMFVLFSGTEGLGHFYSSLSENRPPTVSLLATRSHPRTWQLSILIAEPPSSWGYMASFSGGLQRLPVTPQVGWNKKRRGWLVNRRRKGIWNRNSQPTIPLLCSLQPHPATGGNWTCRLICVSVECWDREEASSNFKCSWRGGNHLHGTGLLSQKTDHWGS